MKRSVISKRQTLQANISFPSKTFFKRRMDNNLFSEGKDRCTYPWPLLRVSPPLLSFVLGYLKRNCNIAVTLKLQIGHRSWIHKSSGVCIMEYEELRRGGDPIITLYLHFIPRLEYSESFRGHSLYKVECCWVHFIDKI